MKKAFGNSLIAITIFIVTTDISSKAAQTDSIEASLRIVVHFMNEVDIYPNILGIAGQVVARNLKKAGVQIIFEDQSKYWETSQAEDALPRLCHLYVRIISQETAKVLGLPVTALGTVPGTRDLTNCYIMHHVLNEHFGIWGDTNRGVILGYAITHEIGHVLGIMDHSQIGIMKAKWDNNDIFALITGRMTFSSREAALIRAEVARRSQKVGMVESSDQR